MDATIKKVLGLLFFTIIILISVSFFSHPEPVWTEMNANASWQARSGHSSVALPDGTIVLMGGDADYLGITNDVWRSTDYGINWTLVAQHAPWTKRTGHSSVAMPDGSIVLMGGYTIDIYLNDVWRSTDGGTTWSRVNASAGWSPRASHNSVVMADDSILLIGGFTNHTSDGEMNDVWRSTNNGTTWTQMTATAGWSLRGYQSVVALPDGSVEVMGGIGDGGCKGCGAVIYNDVWRSTDNGITWTQVTEKANWSARTHQSTVALPDSSIVLMGGLDNNKKNDTWRSTDKGATWTLVNKSSGWPARVDPTSVVMPDGSIVLMGGWTKDVWRFGLPRKIVTATTAQPTNGENIWACSFNTWKGCWGEKYRII
jgi:hypothetical protein